MTKTEVLRVRVTPGHLRAVDALAEKTNVNRSEIVRRVIEAEIQRHGVWSPAPGDKQQEGKK